MPKRVRQIDQLIVNSPFAEPARHWSYDRENRLFTLTDGRRSAGYVVATEGSKSFDDPGVFVELPLVNKIRGRVNDWREAGYPGVTGITKRLLEHWHDPEHRDSSRRFFFCGLEAVETLIWLTEASPADKQGIEIPGDGGPFTRLCSKMATGSGKTNVMGMVISWHVLNKVTYPQDKRFSKNVFVVAPGLTVKSRLQVLIPDSPGNCYDEFGMIPQGLHDKLRRGKVIVRNWHALNWESDEQISRKRGVDKRGAKSDEAYVREVLEEMASARNIVVFNDEAHHAWRLPAGSKVAGVSRADIDEATMWVGGLDRIHRARGILNCYDLSATPFVPSGKKSSDEALFEWVVSDFGLNDAIEAGLVKTPRVVVRDDALPNVADYKSRLYHIYLDPDVKDDLNRKAEEHDPLRRRVLLTLNMNRVVQHIWEAIRFQNAERLEPVFDHEQPIRSTGNMPTWYTGKPCERTDKSHISHCVYDSTWEASEAFDIDHSDLVTAWAKNDHLGFEIVYVFNGIVRKFRPDFLIRLATGTNLVLEVKGEDSQQNKTKRKFLTEWVDAVNQHGGFGRWASDVSFDPNDVPDILAKHEG